MKSKFLDGFQNLAARLGLGADNIQSQGTYVLSDFITRDYNQLESMYRGSWVVGVIIDAIAEDMTRAGITITGDIDPEQIEKIQSKLTSLNIWKNLLDTIKWGRLYGGAIAIINIDGQSWQSPLKIETVGTGQFKGLRVYDRWQLQADLQNLNDDGLPESYKIIEGNLRGTVIHHSRCIRQIGTQLPQRQAEREELWGSSVIERLHDRLIGFDTATSGATQLVHKAYLRTVKVEGLRDILAAGGRAEENLVTMFQYVRLLQQTEGITLLDTNDEFQTNTYNFSGLPEMILQLGQQLSGAEGIPLVRLFGQSPAGLNSTGESDLRIYYDGINSRQESRLREGIDKILKVLHMSEFGALPDDGFNFNFASLWQTSDKEKTDIASVHEKTVQDAFESGIIDVSTAMKELKQMSDITGIFSNVTEDMINEAENEPPDTENVQEDMT